MKKGYFTTALLLLHVATSYAISASPASHNFDYHEGIEKYDLTIRNDETRTLELSLKPTGAFAAAIDVPATLTINPGESVRILVSIKAPLDVTPGTTESGILIESKPVGASTVSAASAVQHVIRMRVPQTGTHLQASLLYSQATIGKPLTLTIALRNIGTNDINRVNATIHVDGQAKFELSTPAVSLTPTDEANLIASFVPQEPGVYTFTAVVEYDGRYKNLSGTAVLGEYSVSIADIIIGEFRLGDPFRISTSVANHWGDALPVSVITEVVQNGTVRTRGQSTGVLVQAQEVRDLPVFMESNGLSLGPAEIVTTVNYGTKAINKTLPVIVGVDDLRLASMKRSNTGWYLFAVALLCLMLFIWKYWWPRRKK